MLNPLLQFTWANIAYIFSGKLRSQHGYKPLSNHAVPNDFSCVGVATSENPATDDYILTQLHALNIKRVRLDFTYGDFDNHVTRFVQRLLQSSYKVHLHLVQPLAQAQQMHSTAEQQVWQNFVEEVCVRFGTQVALIEVGSTINRKRWAGYDLNSFLIMWGIAHRVIKSHQIILAGFSVTDFEPLYNIGILSILKKRGQLPDIHTDNLFSERCTEPERDDHKILGHRLAPYGGFRLVKKAYVLQAIGKHFGVPNFHSPAAFWTLPRIARLLPNTLDKQADYLARYMILCAASGVMKSAAWGPLICHREGLIDEGNTPYPALERITHYESIKNNINDYQIRPAFKAYQAFNHFIPSLKYIGQCNDTDFLEVHTFEKDNYQLHAVWTTNGKAAALVDIYQVQDLVQATFYNLYAEKINPPDNRQAMIASESPMYIIFNSQQAINIQPKAAILPNVAIHRHQPNQTFYAYHESDWEGIIAAKTPQEYALLADALNPAHIQKPDKSTILRNARNAIWTISDPRDPTKKLVIKQPVKMHLHKKILDRNKPSKALRSWSGANELLRRGIDNATPIAYFEQVDDNSLMQNYYICEYVSADFSVRDMFTAYASGQSEFQGVSQQTAYQSLCDYLFEMHSKGVFFRDLSGGNILVQKISTTTLKFSLIDTARAHFYNHGTALNKRLSDMSRACNKLDTQGRNSLMTMYMHKMNSPFGLMQKLPFIIYNAKVILKRSLKRKNIKKSIDRFLINKKK